jgi:protein-S-isoprenylcysteine O-methyltransferase Ste14
MTLDALQWWINRAGAAALVVALAALCLGLARGVRRQQPGARGWASRLLRAPLFYVVTSVLYFGFCFLIWRPLPLTLSPLARGTALLLGVLLYFAGLGLVLWARLTLGKMYFGSSVLGAPLYADHRLITDGPFAIVRHPLYLGILLTGLGGVLIYRTWTFLFVALHFPGLVLRAWREEQALAAAFGEQWEAYRRQVPAWIPRFRR